MRKRQPYDNSRKWALLYERVKCAELIKAKWLKDGFYVEHSGEGTLSGPSWRGVYNNYMGARMEVAVAYTKKGTPKSVELMWVVKYGDGSRRYERVSIDELRHLLLNWQ